MCVFESNGPHEIDTISIVHQMSSDAYVVASLRTDATEWRELKYFYLKKQTVVIYVGLPAVFYK